VETLEASQVVVAAFSLKVESIHAFSKVLGHLIL
jgi:hypothetical protein